MVRADWTRVPSSMARFSTRLVPPTTRSSWRIFTRQVAEELTTVIGREDVAVTVRGTHLCMSMRGVRMEAARTTTVHTGGRFRTDAVLSQQFLTIAASQSGEM